MNILALDLGGTKISAAIFNETADILWENYALLEGRQGDEVAQLLQDFLQQAIYFLKKERQSLDAVGVGIPGVSYLQNGTVYAPNIPGWENYPLKAKLKEIAPDLPIVIESDRACYIMGEKWKGVAKDAKDAIFIAVGTGIGAGILANGQLIRGYGDIAGAIGWMALNRPHQDRYVVCGCFETYASGGGLQREINRYIQTHPNYHGYFRAKDASLNTSTLVNQYKLEDEVAQYILQQAVEMWGMAVANLISLFNPQQVIFGGGVFGAAQYFLEEIKIEAQKWAQPLSMQQVEILASSTAPKTGLLGAAYLAKNGISYVSNPQ